MKNKVFLSALVLSVVGLSDAPLLIKNNHPGHVMPSTAQVQSCAVYANRVEITNRYGYGGGENDFTAVETRPVNVTASVRKAIADAAKAPLTETDNFLCDGPGSYIATGKTVLFSTGGCGTKSQQREGTSARQLMALINSFCPVTYTGGIDGVSPGLFPPLTN